VPVRVAVDHDVPAAVAYCTVQPLRSTGDELRLSSSTKSFW
jgi:hypothetical protein